MKRAERGKTRGYLQVHTNVLELIATGHRVRETLFARHLPMVVSPQDWYIFIRRFL